MANLGKKSRIVQSFYPQAEPLMPPAPPTTVYISISSICFFFSSWRKNVSQLCPGLLREARKLCINYLWYPFLWVIYIYKFVHCIQWSLYFTTLYCKTRLDYNTAWFGPKRQVSVLSDLYFKTTCNIRPHFLGPMGGLKMEELLY